MHQLISTNVRKKRCEVMQTLSDSLSSIKLKLPKLKLIQVQSHDIDYDDDVEGDDGRQAPEQKFNASVNVKPRNNTSP